MAKQHGHQKTGRSIENGAGSEFFRGVEKSFDGGEKAVYSPVGSCFDYPIAKGNALADGLNDEPKAGRVVGHAKGRRS